MANTGNRKEKHRKSHERNAARAVERRQDDLRNSRG